MAEELVRATPLDAGWAALSEGDGDIGTRMVRTYLGIWEHQDTGASMVAMLQSATSNPDEPKGQ